MKCFYYIALITLANPWALQAQTSTNANTNAVNQILALVTTNAPAAKPKPSETVITADGPAEFDQANHMVRVTYRDHVRVDSPQLKLWCEWLVADLPETSGHPTNIVAETNVVIDATGDKGAKMHATGDKAVYAFRIQNGVTNETVTLTGDAEAHYKQITFRGEQIVLDLIHHTLSSPTNSKTFIVQGNLASSASGSNSVAVQTNLPIVETNLPPAGTNQTTPPK